MLEKHGPMTDGLSLSCQYCESTLAAEAVQSKASYVGASTCQITCKHCFKAPEEDLHTRSHLDECCQIFSRAQLSTEGCIGPTSRSTSRLQTSNLTDFFLENAVIFQFC